MLETVSRRVLAALRVVDGVTGVPVLAPLSLSAVGTRWVRSRRGLYVITEAPGFEAYQDAGGSPPPIPAEGTVSVAVLVQDPAGVYLSRMQTVRLPRNPDPAHASEPESLFQPVDVRMYLSPAAPVSPAWALIRATVVRDGGADRLGGALIRVVRSGDGQVLARGMSDQRGEALIAVPGIPVTTWDDAPGPVLGTDVEVQVEVIWDPAGSGAPDPEWLEAQRAALPHGHVAMKLASGRTVVRTLTVAIP